MRALATAANEGNINALVAMQYSYAGSRLLWQLDDNTLTLDELAIKQAELDRMAEKFNVALNANDYDESMLELF